MSSNLQKQFKLLDKKLGEGHFATVRLGQSQKTGAFVAIKVVEKSKLKPEDVATLRKEASILKSLKHKHVIELLGFYDETLHFFIVTEYLEGGELFDRIAQKESYSEADAAKVIASIASALHYCHSKGIVHRDIKPENLLLVSRHDDTTVKLADFGLAAEVKENTNGLKTPCGTPGYCAPEIIRGDVYDSSVDMWSLGVVAFILLGGYPPFYHRNQREMLKIIVRGQFEFVDDFWSDISDQAKSFIRFLLKVDPESRLTAYQAQKHPWLTKREKHPNVKDLKEAQKRLNDYQVERKLRMTMGALQVLTRLQMAAKNI